MFWHKVSHKDYALRIGSNLGATLSLFTCCWPMEEEFPMVNLNI